MLHAEEVHEAARSAIVSGSAIVFAAFCSARLEQVEAGVEENRREHAAEAADDGVDIHIFTALEDGISFVVQNLRGDQGDQVLDLFRGKRGIDQAEGAAWQTPAS